MGGHGLIGRSRMIGGIGFAGYLLLLVLPGAWVTFGLRLADTGFSTRLLIGVVLSPLIVCLQYYALRFFGLGFESAAVLLPLLNLPALALVLFGPRGRPEPVAPRIAVGWLAALALPVGLLAVRWHDPAIQTFYGHGWMHADIIHRLASGELRPGEPELAGVWLSYAWFGHVIQAVGSYLIQRPPPASYFWLNLAMVTSVFGLTARIVGELGGRRLTRMTSIVWVAFGLNFIGYWVARSFPETLGESFWLGFRFTPWLRGYYEFSQQGIALAMIAAIAVLCVRLRRARGDTSIWTLLWLLLAGVGMIYPILFPAGGALLGARALALLVDREPEAHGPDWGQIFGCCFVVLTAGLVTFGVVRMITVDRVGDAVALEAGWMMKLQAYRAGSAFLLLGLLALLAVPRLWRERRRGLITLLVAAGGMTAVSVAAHLGATHAEYKYLFAVAIFVAPITAIALERWFDRLRPRAALAFVPLAVILAIPAYQRMILEWPYIPSDPPPVVIDGFEIRLAPHHPLAELTDTLRASSPKDAVLVTRHAELHMPTLTGRQLYAPFGNHVHDGVGLDSDFVLIQQRGYDERLIEERRAVLARLYTSSDPKERLSAIDEIRTLGRPVAVIAEPGPDSDLAETLELSHGPPWRVTGDFAVWLIAPHGETDD